MTRPMPYLASVDPAIARLIDAEAQREATTINFIASENYASAAVREATGSVLTNKYAEGFPGKRYYPGCEVVDQVEQLAIDRCKELFGADAANVQPHSGSSANLAAYAALLKPGATILGMSLAHGGHLTHGHGVNFSGTMYRSVAYGVDPETECINYDEVERIAHESKPALIIVGASAYSRTIDFERAAAIARSVNAYLLADIAHIAGLVAVGLHPSPVKHADVVTSTTHKTLRGPRGALILAQAAHAEAINKAIMPGTQGGPILNTIAGKATCFHEAATPAFRTYQEQVIATAQKMAETFKNLGYRIVSGGTDNHLFIIDLSGTAHTGLSAEQRLASVGITVSRSCIPFDTRKPWVTSGIRIGTPAMTTRGMTLQDAERITHLIHEILCAPTETALIPLRTEVQRIAEELKIPESFLREGSFQKPLRHNGTAREMSY